MKKQFLVKASEDKNSNKTRILSSIYDDMSEEELEELEEQFKPLLDIQAQMYDLKVSIYNLKQAIEEIEDTDLDLDSIYVLDDNTRDALKEMQAEVYDVIDTIDDLESITFNADDLLDDFIDNSEWFDYV